MLGEGTLAVASCARDLSCTREVRSSSLRTCASLSTQRFHPLQQKALVYAEGNQGRKELRQDAFSTKPVWEVPDPLRTGRSVPESTSLLQAWDSLLPTHVREAELARSLLHLPACGNSAAPILSTRTPQDLWETSRGEKPSESAVLQHWELVGMWPGWDGARFSVSAANRLGELSGKVIDAHVERRIAALKVANLCEACKSSTRAV